MCFMLHRLLCRACGDMVGVFNTWRPSVTACFFTFQLKQSRPSFPPQVCYYCHSELRQGSESQLQTSSQNVNPIFQCAVCGMWFSRHSHQSGGSSMNTGADLGVAPSKV